MDQKGPLLKKLKKLREYTPIKASGSNKTTWRVFKTFAIGPFVRKKFVIPLKKTPKAVHENIIAKVVNPLIKDNMAKMNKQKKTKIINTGKIP